MNSQWVKCTITSTTEYLDHVSGYLNLGLASKVYRAGDRTAVAFDLDLSHIIWVDETPEELMAQLRQMKSLGVAA